MRAGLGAGALVLLALLSGCAAPSLTGAAPSSQALTLLTLVNQARGAPRDCGATAFAATRPLTLDPRLTRAAQLHSQDMLASGDFSHTGSDGSTLAQRVDAQGYAWSALGEDIAYGYGSAQAAVQAWLQSPPHCSAIMGSQYQNLGAGVAGSYWTLDFGAPR